MRGGVSRGTEAEPLPTTMISLSGIEEARVQSTICQIVLASVAAGNGDRELDAGGAGQASPTDLVRRLLKRNQTLPGGDTGRDPLD
jgi:hypothetical protein